MISGIDGTLVHDLGGLVEIDTQSGLRYEIRVPVKRGEGSFFGEDMQGRNVFLVIHHHRTEALEALYGFQFKEDRDLFRLLIDKVSGVGPSVALAVLSQMSASEFQSHIASGNVPAIVAIKGVGKKTAEKIVLELNDKVGISEIWASRKQGTVDPAIADAQAALVSLGYKAADAKKAVEAAVVAKRDQKQTAEELIRGALAAANRK